MNSVNYNELTQDELNKALVHACIDGDLNLAKYLLESDDLNIKADLEFNYRESVKSATLFGRIEIVKYLLKNKHSDYSGTIYNSSFETGQLEILKYLFTLPTLKKDKSHIANMGIIMSATFGQEELLNYFLTDIQFKNINKIKTLSDIFPSTCEKGHVNILKYLLNYPEFVNNVNVSDMIYYGIYEACKNNQMAVFNYFIFDLKIEMNQHIRDYLVENNRYDIVELFNKRELNRNLHENLETNHQSTKKIKI
jgi:hypothetical protein